MNDNSSNRELMMLNEIRKGIAELIAERDALIDTLRQAGIDWERTDK